MDPIEILDEQVNNYLHNRLSADDAALLENKLASDPELNREVGRLKQLKFYYNKDLLDFKKSIREAEQRYRQKTSVTKKRFNLIVRKKTWLLAIAASILFMAGILYFPWNKVDTVQLAKENSLDGLNKASVRKGDSIAVADVLFYSGDYRHYIDKALSLLKNNPDSIERSILHINICKSYIQLGQANNAIAFYQSLPEQEQQYCYLQYQAALAYVIAKNKKEGLRLFQAVIDKDCFPVDQKAGEWTKRLE